MMTSEQYFGGCEGGGSKSTMVIVDSTGKILGEASVGGTNQWLIGMDECCKRLEDLVSKAKAAAGMDATIPLSCLGLSLSGADNVEKQEEISNTMISKYPHTAKHCFTCNDTLSPLVTATDGGGVVLIAGTGSNCLLVNPSGLTVNCGGWGHILGDQGSAHWIAMEALRIIFEDNDGFSRSPHGVEYLKKAMFKYFEMKDMFSILPHLYPPNNGVIDKKHIATFCIDSVVEGAQEHDKLSLHILATAGQELGKHIKALIPKMDAELLNQPGGLKIICIGSVWKSWMFLKEGFLQGLSPQTDEEKLLKEFSLLNLKSIARASVGAASWAAKKANLSVSINYTEMANIFFTHHF